VKRKRFSVEQITAVLKQAESGSPIGDVCRQAGVSEQTFYRWKKVYGGMLPGEARELKQLREENSRLKRLVADLTLDKVMLQDIVQKECMVRPRSARGTPVLRSVRDNVSGLLVERVRSWP
jgi:putative transposase